MPPGEATEGVAVFEFKESTSLTGGLYDLQISDDVAEVLTFDGLVRLDLSVSSRRLLSCAVCTAPLGPPRPPTSVVVVRDPCLGRTAVRLAHAACARSEVRLEAMTDGAAATAPPGHEWNLIRRGHPDVPAVLTWESRPGFERSAVAPPRPSSDTDAIARGLRRLGFTPASGPFARLLPTSLCGMTLARAGHHLVLLRQGRRWLEFSDAAVSDGTDVWLAEAARGGRVVLLYGPGLGGEALTAASLARVLSSGTALCGTVRLQEPEGDDSRLRCGGRSLAPGVAAGSTRPRPRGAHRLA